MSKQLMQAASVAVLSMILFAVATSLGGFEAALTNPLAGAVPQMGPVAILK